MAENPDILNSFTARDLAPVVPSDTADLPVSARAIRVGTGGTAATGLEAMI